MSTYEKRETTNDVILQGKIVHVFSTSNVTIMTLATRTATSVVNYPKVVFFSPVKEQADKFKERDYVEISANIQSSKRKPDIKNQVTLALFGESIREAKSVMETAFDMEGNYIPNKNEFKLSGSVVSVNAVTNNIHRITVRTDKNSRPSFVQLTKFINNKNDPILEVRPGEFVYVLGHVQTHKSQKGDETKYFQNYVISEFKK